MRPRMCRSECVWGIAEGRGKSVGGKRWKEDPNNSTGLGGAGSELRGKNRIMAVSSLEYVTIRRNMRERISQGIWHKKVRWLEVRVLLEISRCLESRSRAETLSLKAGDTGFSPSFCQLTPPLPPLRADVHEIARTKHSLKKLTSSFHGFGSSMENRAVQVVSVGLLNTVSPADFSFYFSFFCFIW